MKKITTLLASALLTTTAFGQTSLPAAWNFDDPQPVGWTEELSNNPGNTRYTNGFVDAACKLDGDDEYVQVHFSDVCGGVSYYLIGQSSASNDVFTVQESANGTDWTTLRLFEEADLDAASSFTQFTDVPLPASRYVRWYFTEKQSGRNVGIDEIELLPQVPTNDQEIGVSSGVTPIVNNGTFVVGNQTTTTISLENVNLLGGSDLTISSITISGVNASDFSLGATPTSVGPTATEQFDLNFTAGAMGSRFATLTIENDDANGDETTFVIDLYGIGGDFATEPAGQPTNLGFADVTSYGYDVSFDDATTVPENYIVLRSIGSPIAALDNPVDGETYVKGDYINGTQVVHVGAAGTFRPSYVVASADYYFAAYAFNGPSGYENYLTETPLIANVTSESAMIGNYYDGVDPNQTSFIADLQTRISQNYSQIFYSNYAPVMINKFASRDTTDGQKVVTGVYSGFQHVYPGAFFYDVLSREHSWPHSWMPTFLEGSDGDEYSDIHNLFPAHQNSANAVRSNLPLGIVTDEASSFLDAKFGDDAIGNRVYEPRDQHKGDAARAIFYMAVKWNGTGNETWELPNPIDFLTTYGQDQDVLKQWHLQDPPDQWEMARNDFIQSEQGNRNPFVDSVDWVCYIDFETLTYISNPSLPCATTPDGIGEKLAGDFSVSPNPSNGEITLNLNLVETQDLTIELMDISGRSVATQARSFNSGLSRQSFDFSNLDAGIYHMVLTGEKGRTGLKVILQ